MSALKYWLWLGGMQGLGIKTAKQLLDYFGSPKDIYFARDNQYAFAGVNAKEELKLLSNKNLDKASEIWRICDEIGIRILTMQDAEYPLRLSNIYDPPLLLYIKGRLPVIDEEVVIGMVGTRRATPYGLRAAEQLGYEVTKEGGIIVSGLADGIDTAAIRGSLRAGGKPIAVLGTGLDVYYPLKNRELQDDIAQIGTLISEYPPGTAAKGDNFPIRNRLISGISVGVAIVEAPRHSGALITAAKALDQGRDVFVVPGNIDSPACEGSNALLKDKCAIAVTSGWDIVSEFERAYPQKVRRVAEKLKSLKDEKLAMSPENKAAAVPIYQDSTELSVDNRSAPEYIDLKAQLEELSEDELNVVTVMHKKEMHIDDIIELSGQAPSRVLSALTSLELKGYAVGQKGRRYSLILTKDKGAGN
jgi:DNA processing protein